VGEESAVGGRQSAEGYAAIVPEGPNDRYAPTAHSATTADCRLPTADSSDVIVVGGGPAGAAAATHLVRRGWRVVLLEGRDLAHQRAADLRSGEVLSPGGQAELHALGLPTGAADWRFESFATIRTRWPSGHTTDDPLPHGLAYWQTDRGKLDRALFAFADAAGAQTHDSQRVRALLRDRRGAVCGVTTRDETGNGREWHAPIVIDASGRYSAILHELGGRQPDPEFRRAALVTFYAEFPGCTPGVWEQHFLARYGAAVKGARMGPNLYRFSLELDLAAREAYARRLGSGAPHELTLMILRELAPHLHARFRAATPLPHRTAYGPLAYRVRRIIDDGLLLIGDAAGYLDPGTGQGIEFALRTARVAAVTVDRALRLGDPRAERFAPYVTARGREIARAMAWLRLYLRLTRRAPLLDLASHAPPLRAGLIRAMVQRPRAQEHD
jgi:flavin-dependent dehydrogenase